jgi:hypothetical protein
MEAPPELVAAFDEALKVGLLEDHGGGKLVLCEEVIEALTEVMEQQGVVIAWRQTMCPVDEARVVANISVAALEQCPFYPPLDKAKRKQMVQSVVALASPLIINLLTRLSAIRQIKRVMWS